MRASFLSLLAAILPLEVCAQGQIVAANRVQVQGFYAPVLDTDCTTPLSRGAFLAQAYVGFRADSLSPIGSILNFLTGITGYVVPVALTVPGTGSNDLVYFQLRAWETKAGSSFEAAVAAGGKHGLSNIVPMKTVLPPGTPNVPLGLESFCLVPEPSAASLLVMGIGAWFVIGRRPTVLEREPNRRSERAHP